jgi:hypothetical protein
MHNGAYVESESVFKSIRSGQNVREIQDLDVDYLEPDEDLLTGATVYYEILEAVDSGFTGVVEMVKTDGSSYTVPEEAILDAQSGKSGDLLSRVHTNAFYVKDIERNENGSISRIVYTERE